MGDADSNKIIFSPLRVQRQGDYIPIVIPTQEEYANYKNSLRYNRYVLHSFNFNKFLQLSKQGVKNIFWGESAEDLAQRFGRYLSSENFSFPIEMNFLKPPFQNFSCDEKNKAFSYDCYKFNDEEKIGFMLGLEKCKELWGKWDWNIFD
jgi:hypothetical protein